METTAKCEAMVRGIAVDSRNVKPGDLFFALPGDQTDGHAFLSDAAAKGAVGAVVKKDYAGPDYGMALVRCEDCLKALQMLAKTYLKRHRPKVVAVTGSLGKTTTKDFIAQLLQVKYKVSVSPGNSNSQIGLPLTILNHSQDDDEILILEMGMTHPGQILKLIDIAPPTVAVVTTVALVHACNFNSLTDIARAKAEIFMHPDTEIGFYPQESDHGHVLSTSGTCRKVSFSLHSQEAKTILTKPLPVPGEHNRHNFLAAASVARYLGLSLDEIHERMAALHLPERRLQHVEKFGALFINDAYNASEMSMKAALNSLPTPKAGSKRIAVLADMLELGKFSEGCHRAVAQHALDCVDLMLCFGNECRYINECWQQAGRPVVWAPERSEIVKALRTHLQPGDVVLLKGSRGKGVWKVLEEL